LATDPGEFVAASKLTTPVKLELKDVMPMVGAVASE
jgi:hypothetical protein